jgi:hypothetical protein
MSSWASLVFTRTFHLDYRFLSVPEDFGEEARNAARPFIYGALSGTDFGGQLRWAAFRAGRNFILGCSGTATGILGSERVVDRHQREVYAFVAIVLKEDRPASIPPPERLLSTLRGILDGEFDEVWMTPFETPPRQCQWKEESLGGKPLQSGRPVEPAGVMIRPDEGPRNWALVREIAASPHRSVCIGMQERGDLYDGEGRLYPFTDFVIQGQHDESRLLSPETPLESPAPVRPTATSPPAAPGWGSLAPPRAPRPTGSGPADTTHANWIPVATGAGLVGVLVWATTRSAFLLVCSAAAAGAGVYALGRWLAGKARPTFASREGAELSRPEERRWEEPATVAPPSPFPRKERRSPWV